VNVAEPFDDGHVEVNVHVEVNAHAC